MEGEIDAGSEGRSLMRAQAAVRSPTTWSTPAPSPALGMRSRRAHPATLAAPLACLSPSPCRLHAGSSARLPVGPFEWAGAGCARLARSTRRQPLAPSTSAAALAPSPRSSDAGHPDLPSLSVGSGSGTKRARSQGSPPQPLLFVVQRLRDSSHALACPCLPCALGWNLPGTSSVEVERTAVSRRGQAPSSARAHADILVARRSTSRFPLAGSLLQGSFRCPWAVSATEHCCCGHEGSQRFRSSCAHRGSERGSVSTARLESQSGSCSPLTAGLRHGQRGIGGRGGTCCACPLKRRAHTCPTQTQSACESSRPGFKQPSGPSRDKGR